MHKNEAVMRTAAKVLADMMADCSMLSKRTLEAHSLAAIYVLVRAMEQLEHLHISGALPDENSVRYMADFQ